MRKLMSKKTLYICGDSFCSRDPEYGDNWVDMFNLAAIDIINLSSPGASNYLIYLQVKEAILKNADYIIYQASSSIRNEFSIKPTSLQKDELNRYWNVTAPADDASVVCCSWINPWGPKYNLTIFSSTDITQIQDFFVKNIDLTSLVEKNYIFILHTLQILTASNIPYAWSQGGFEHKMWESTNWWDFSAYKDHECKINLWDYYDSNVIRPYYHVTDKQILQDVCNEYINMLNLHDA